MRRLTFIGLWVFAVMMIAIGIMHFVSPEPFMRIVPAALPAPRLLVYISGVCEIAGGIGILTAKFRRAAAWGLVLLFVAVFPANINMAIREIQLSETGTMPVLAMWARLPFQAVFIAIAYAITRIPGGEDG